MIGDELDLWYASNRAQQFARRLGPGVYGLSNQLLDTPTPKLRRLRRRFEEWLRTSKDRSADALFDMLADAEPGSPDERDSQPSVPSDLTRALSAPFVKHPTFGTRCSTVVLMDNAHSTFMAERSFDASGRVSGEVSARL
jgi:uncharacterized protein with NRDE domain